MQLETLLLGRWLPRRLKQRRVLGSRLRQWLRQRSLLQWNLLC
jgi:hypothetical protein